MRFLLLIAPIRNGNDLTNNIGSEIYDETSNRTSVELKQGLVHNHYVEPYISYLYTNDYIVHWVFRHSLHWTYL